MKFYISYSRPEKEFAERLGGELRKQGALVVSDRELLPGLEWPSFIRRQIEESSALILLVPSSDSPHRNNVWFEAGAARALGKQVLAIVPPGREIEIKELPVEMAGLLVLDAGERSLENIAATLVQAAKSFRA